MAVAILATWLLAASMWGGHRIAPPPEIMLAEKIGLSRKGVI